jgi:dipeptidyl aminopeptidase/acylaminoacyl peptidase
MAKVLGIFAAILILLIAWSVIKKGTIQTKLPTLIPSPTASIAPSDLMNIQFMRSQNYPGSKIKIEETLSSGSNYNRYIVSFTASGLKEFALMTVPTGQKPAGGFPVIVFNHGYITPEKYTPDGNYIAYVDALAASGYIVFKPNYRGNGKSEGSPGSTYFSPNYAVDDLNAIAAIKKYPDANPNKIGIWGHSMGGDITLRVSEISKDVKAAVIWGGVVGNYNDILYNWQNRVSYQPAAEDLYLRNLGSQELLAQYGTPSQNPAFWNLIDPTENLNFINIPFQIHVGAADEQVPPDFSSSLYNKLTALGKTAEFYEYPGANHDINQSFSLAMQRTIDFFNLYLK